MGNKLALLSKRIGNSLRKRGMTLAVAESCTGGLFSSVITDIPGSSDYFLAGVVAYSNTQKEKLLKIPRLTLRRHSSVSSRVAILMARNIREIAKADIGIGITGFAGPAGGTKRDPKGTVYIAAALGSRSSVKKYRFKGRRAQIKRKAVEQALTAIYKTIKL